MKKYRNNPVFNSIRNCFAFLIELKRSARMRTRAYKEGCRLRGLRGLTQRSEVTRRESFASETLFNTACICLAVGLLLTSCPPGAVWAEEITETVGLNREETEASANSGNQGPEISAPSAILMEASTGTVIYDKNGHEQLRPASVTKIMTLLLIFEALDRGEISLDQEMTVSEYAASMGGSQVFLEPGEVQTVQTLIKCIAVASANDACVVMAEALKGSEEEFVKQMNKRADELGMKDTHFVNCCGLDVDGHLTTAYDIGLMSRELITKHPEIYDYCQIWMDTIIHSTKRGDSEFGLTNTNKLIRQYEYATGLKTGSTSLAKYCVSATARKDDIDLIAVIMAAPDYKVRFEDAVKLFGYGYGICKLYKDEEVVELSDLSIKGAVESNVAVKQEGGFSYLDTQGIDISKIEKTVVLPESVTAPVKKNDIAGAILYLYEGKEIGRINILYEKSVEKANFASYFFRALKRLCVFRESGKV